MAVQTLRVAGEIEPSQYNLCGLSIELHLAAYCRVEKLKTEKPLQDARTKTVATVGPACASVEMLVKLLKAGADVFRINMAHGGREAHELAIANIRAAAEQTGFPAGILIDLAGPKIRLGQLSQDPLEIQNGQKVRFVRGLKSTSDDELTCNYESLVDEVTVGEDIVLADGIVRLEVTEKTADQLTCNVVDGGKIRSRQGVNLPGTNLSVPALGEIDIDNAIWAAGQGLSLIHI